MKNIKNYGMYGLLVVLAIGVVPLKAAQRPPNEPWWKRMAYFLSMGQSQEDLEAQRKIANKNLIRAIVHSSTKEAYEALQAGADPNAGLYGPLGYAPLLYAIAEAPDNLPLIRLLLQHGARVNTQSIENGRTPLLLATSHNNMPLVELLLSHGAQETINTPDDPGYTPLNVAVNNNNLALVELLLLHGASNTPNNNDVLKQATTPEIYALLVIADIIPASDEETAAVISSLSDENRARALRIMQTRLSPKNGPLIVHGIQLFAKLGDKQAQAQLNNPIATGTNLPPELSSMVADYANRFSYGETHTSQHNINPDSEQEQKKSKYEAEPGIKGLEEEEGSDDEFQQDVQLKGLDAFMHACWTGDTATVTSMIDTIDINAHAPNLQNMTPLIMAAAMGHADIVQLLLNSGAEITATDNGGNTALGIAIRNSHDNVVRALCVHAQRHNQIEKLLRATHIHAALEKMKPDKRAQMEKLIGQYVNLTEEEL